MVSQCANPDCGAPFLYLREGKLFAVRRPGLSARQGRVEYFWLCGNCAGRLGVDDLFREHGALPSPWTATRTLLDQPL